MKNTIDSIYHLQTPCYIIDEKKLKSNFFSLNSAFLKAWGKNFKIGYSFKTNSLPWLLGWMKSKDVYAEVVSETETLLAERLGFSWDNIILNGPYKGFESMKRVLDDGGIVNLDSFHEIKWLEQNKPCAGKSWNVGLRINFNLESYCPGETIVGHNFSRFGFNLENGSFQEAVSKLENLPYIKITGLHSHNSTKTKSLKVFKTAAQKIIEASKYLKYQNLNYIDMGGALWGDKPNAPNFKDYAYCITDELKKKFNPEKVSLFLEPGASLIASPVSYLCKIIDIKNVNDIKFISTDGSLIHINPQMTGVKFTAEFFNTLPSIHKKQVVAGFTCIENDRMIVLENHNELQNGELILFHNVGSYSMSLSPLFIRYFPRVYVKDFDGCFKIVRETWSVDEYIQKGSIYAG